jgi:methionyl-tRNA synthetase
MERIDFSLGLESIMGVVSDANRYIEAMAPWKIAKVPSDRWRLEQVLRVLAEVLRIVSLTLEPFMPAVAPEIWRQLGLEGLPRRFDDAAAWPGPAGGRALGTHPVLFPKPDAATRER